MAVTRLNTTPRKAMNKSYLTHEYIKQICLNKPWHCIAIMQMEVVACLAPRGCWNDPGLHKHTANTLEKHF